MANEVAVKQENAVATADQMGMMAEFDYGQVSSKDLKIPKILLMQAMSKFVNEDGTAKAGDLVNSVTGEVYGSVREKDYKPIKIVPIHMFKQWVVHEKIGNELEYREMLPVTPSNEDWRWEFTDESGREYKRTFCTNFYVLLEKDIGNPLAVPHVLTYRNTSSKGAAALTNHFALCKAAQAAKQFRVPMGKWFEVGGKGEKNDKGSFFVMNAKELSDTTPEIIKQAFDWYKLVSKSQHKDVDQSEFVTSEPSTIPEEF